MDEPFYKWHIYNSDKRKWGRDGAPFCCCYFFFFSIVVFASGFAWLVFHLHHHSFLVIIKLLQMNFIPTQYTIQSAEVELHTQAQRSIVWVNLFCSWVNNRKLNILDRFFNDFNILGRMSLVTKFLYRAFSVKFMTLYLFLGRGKSSFRTKQRLTEIL